MALSAEVGIPTSELIQSMKGGDIRFQGTWVHPQVAIHLAQWLSPKFAVQVTQWVYDWMSGTSPSSRIEVPYHLRRYVANHQNVPVAHFSVLTEMTQMLIAPMEMMGYTLPEHMVPHISHGRMYCKWLREKYGIDTDALPNYVHVYEDGRRVPAKAYPESLLPDFRKHFREEWLPNRAIDYFHGRDIPGPVVGAGLPGLLMAFVGYFGWRRSRRALATDRNSDGCSPTKIEARP